MLDTERVWLLRIDQWARWCIAAGQSPETIRTRSHWLAVLAGANRQRRPEDLAADDLAATLARPKWKPETRKCARGSIRSFYAWMQAAGHIGHDPAARLPPIRVPRPAPRAVPVSIWAASVAEADQRTQLILMLGRFEGLRRAEVSRLHTSDIGRDGWLIVHGKGGKVRRIPVHPLLLALLLALPPGWLFPSPGGGHLSPGHIGKLASDALPPGWTLHTCRHRAGTEWYAVARDIRAVQELLGHAKVSTTQIYIQVDDASLVAAVHGVSA